MIECADRDHDANWLEYNKMIGLGGWGGRSEKDGPYVYYTNEGKLVRDMSPGGAGSHGPQHQFPVTLRVTDTEACATLGANDQVDVCRSPNAFGTRSVPYLLAPRPPRISGRPPAMIGQGELRR